MTLTVSADGRTAEGRFSPGPERRTARPGSGPTSPTVDVAAEGDVSTTALTEAEFCREANGFSPVEFALGVRLRDCRQAAAPRQGYGRAVWFQGLDDDPSWACVLFRSEPHLTTLVWQGGPRRLWDEAEAAYRWWVGQGEPPPGRFGVTVDGADGRVWLDDPDSVIRRL